MIINLIFVVYQPRLFMLCRLSPFLLSSNMQSIMSGYGTLKPLIIENKIIANFLTVFQ
jgi:hypothetical protein